MPAELGLSTRGGERTGRAGAGVCPSPRPAGLRVLLNVDASWPDSQPDS